MIIRVADFDLRPHNTFRLPCRADRWIEFTSREDIPAVAAESAAGQSIIIGAGSDLLFTQPEYHGTVIHSAILTIDMEPLGDRKVRVTAGSGVTMDDLILRTCQAGLWGLENLSGIPGEVGASAVQNVGAYGCEAGELIESVELFDRREHRFVTFDKADCRFAYRDSIFKRPEAKGRYIIASVTYILSSAPAPRLSYGNLASHFTDPATVTPMEIRETVMAVRNSKLPDPSVTGSAGSYFTNPIVTQDQFEDVCARARTLLNAGIEVPSFLLPDGRVKIPAAWLIDKAGLKGVTEGGAGTWPRQPLVIANMSGNCSAADILALERRIVDTVEKTFGVRLGLEVEKIPMPVLQ